MILAGGVTATAAGVIAAHRYQRRKDLTGERWLWLWKGPFGRWLTRMAGLRLRRLPGGPAIYRPTEIAIGMAADRLFEDLPKAARKSLRDLPPTLRRLEAHARGLRERIERLPAGPARDLERQRLADTVTALETIRLQLLRMHAGATTMESLTADLSAARDVADAVERLLEGQKEVEETLR